MSYPRRIIVPNDSILHISFRCHNQEMLLKSHSFKDKYLRILAKYKKKYRIKIFEFNLMDNHVHLMVKTENASNLSNFMRTTSSQIAMYINKCLGRDSQVFRERFRSGLVSNSFYAVQLIQYIWLNRVRVKSQDAKDPRQDPYCSVSWRLNKPYKQIPNPSSKEEKEHNLLAELLDSYEEVHILKPGQTEEALVKELLKSAFEQVSELVAKMFENVHTIGDELAVSYRANLIAAMRRCQAPPNYQFAV